MTGIKKSNNFIIIVHNHLVKIVLRVDMRRPKKLKEILREKLDDKELAYVPSSFDIVGSRDGAVALVEIPKEIYHRRREIGEAILTVHRNVKAVYAKKSSRFGVYRLRELELIAGEQISEVLHKEYGVSLKLDVLRVYFSPRESTERMRIASQVKEGESVMVMFAGVGPYALIIAKKQPQVDKIVAIEINPVAYRYMVENIKLNKFEDKIIPVLGDVKKVSYRWYGCCDRVVMPLPKGAKFFLDDAFNVLKKEGGYIHFYNWAKENKLYVNAYRELEKSAVLFNREIKIINLRKVLPYSPRVYKVCLDVRVF